MTAITEYKHKIKQLLIQYIDNQNLADDEDIFVSGYVNSLFAMQLVLFIERDFSVQLTSEDLQLENFSTVNAMANLIESKTALSAQSR